MRALAIALLAAGCFSDRGLAIEVDVGDTGSTTVELFAAEAACAADAAQGLGCASLQPRGIERRLAGDLYLGAAAAPFVAQVEGRIARFRLQADRDTVLPILIAFGSTAAGPSGAVTLYDLNLPADRAETVRTTLEAADELTAGSVATGQRAVVWPGADDKTRSCVAVEHLTGGEATRDFIGPADDPDCDGYTGAAECDPEVFKSEHPSPRAAPTCFTAVPGQACLLGAQGCMDGMGRTLTCDPFAAKVCVPDRFCECTGPSGGEACIPRNDETFPGIPHFHCDVHVPVGGDAVCQSDSDTIELPHFGGGDCGNKPVISGPRLADLADASDTHAFGDAELAVSHVDKGCALQFKVSGSHALGTELGMVRITGPGGAMILPIAVSFVALPCVGRRLECRFEDSGPDDKLWACAAPR
jgi:hypothetical protein